MGVLESSVWGIISCYPAVIAHYCLQCVLLSTEDVLSVRLQPRGGGGHVLFANAMYERPYLHYLRFRVFLACGLVRFV
jgi:hypothetical protein